MHSDRGSGMLVHCKTMQKHSPQKNLIYIKVSNWLFSIFFFVLVVKSVLPSTDSALSKLSI